MWSKYRCKRNLRPFVVICDYFISFSMRGREKEMLVTSLDIYIYIYIYIYQDPITNAIGDRNCM